MSYYGVEIVCRGKCGDGQYLTRISPGMYKVKTNGDCEYMHPPDGQLSLSESARASEYNPY